MKHEIKIKKCFLAHIMENRKLFEIRYNDRDYQVGDVIHFLPLIDDNYSLPSNIPEFVINYIHTGYGMQKGFVVLGLEKYHG